MSNLPKLLDLFCGAGGCDFSGYWEHGYRCHGYWLGEKRLGRVGLPPPGTKPLDYGWSIDGTRQEGRVATLREAKRIVETTLSQAKEHARE